MSKDTDGSNLIKALLLDDEEAPIYLHAWGGQSTIARALKSIEEQYKGTPRWAAIRAKVIRKAVIHPSGDQDDTYAKYIKPHWPEIRYVEPKGGIMISYMSQRTLSVEDAAYLSADWTKANISDKGPLGAFYRTWGDGRQMVKGRHLRLFRRGGENRRATAGRGLCRLVAGRGQGLCDRRGRHGHLSEPDRQRPGGLSRQLVRRLGRLSRRRPFGDVGRDDGEPGGGGVRQGALSSSVSRPIHSWPSRSATSPRGSSGRPRRATPTPTTSPGSPSRARA
ncbi:nucleoside hydrolase-like domain-containing protein [Caulobacter segnis]